LYDEALQYLEKAASLTPNDPTINEHIGDVYSKKKNYRKSLEFYQKALSLNPPNEEQIKEKINEAKKLLK
jgi:tetratricopeptide (TPR) repeat protein